uniref:Dendritic cell-specific transmembrane protein-like domain-containing protein n=1 Tax=Timema poppense TaxID=170557 RepID=A0A7R9H5P4_TIMPO|nr:unnamed protein product [Timema poppensis]
MVLSRAIWVDNIISILRGYLPIFGAVRVRTPGHWVLVLEGNHRAQSTGVRICSSCNWHDPVVCVVSRRCYVFLLLPLLFSKRGRQSVMAYTLVLALSGPAKNTMDNMNILSQSMACGQSQPLSDTVRATGKPVLLLGWSCRASGPSTGRSDQRTLQPPRGKNIMAFGLYTNVLVTLMVLKPMNEILKHVLKQILEAIKKPFLAIKEAFRKVMKTIKGFIDKLKTVLLVIKRIIIIIGNMARIVMRGCRPYKLWPCDTAKVIKTVYQWLKSILSICNKKMGTPYERCLRVFDNAVVDCQATLGPMFNWLCSIVYLAKVVCVIAKILDLICMLVEFIKTTVVGTIKRSEWFSLGGSRSRVWMYEYRFMTTERFDNLYITNEFIEMDIRRAAKDMETVLPLSRIERRRYIMHLFDAVVNSQLFSELQETKCIVYYFTACGSTCLTPVVNSQLFSELQETKSIVYYFTACGSTCLTLVVNSQLFSELQETKSIVYYFTACGSTCLTPVVNSQLFSELQETKSIVYYFTACGSTCLTLVVNSQLFSELQETKSIVYYFTACGSTCLTLVVNSQLFSELQETKSIVYYFTACGSTCLTLVVNSQLFSELQETKSIVYYFTACGSTCLTLVVNSQLFSELQETKSIVYYFTACGSTCLTLVVNSQLFSELQETKSIVYYFTACGSTCLTLVVNSQLFSEHK